MIVTGTSRRQRGTIVWLRWAAVPFAGILAALAALLCVAVIVHMSWQYTGGESDGDNFLAAFIPERVPRSLLGAVVAWWAMVAAAASTAPSAKTRTAAVAAVVGILGLGLAAGATAAAAAMTERYHMDGWGYVQFAGVLVGGTAGAILGVYSTWKTESP